MTRLDYRPAAEPPPERRPRANPCAGRGTSSNDGNGGMKRSPQHWGWATAIGSIKGPSRQRAPTGEMRREPPLVDPRAADRVRSEL